MRRMMLSVFAAILVFGLFPVRRRPLWRTAKRAAA